MVYSQVLHSPENFSTPKRTHFNVLRGVPNLIRITGQILEVPFNIVLAFPPIGLQINLKVQKTNRWTDRFF
jgi:hypothetical protein